MKRPAVLVVGALLLLPIALLVASELGEVVVIRSAVDGQALETRIWVVDVPEGLLVRGSEGKAWVEAARRAPDVELERAGTRRRYNVVWQSGPEARLRVNELMREKYGFADRMIGWMREYSNAVPLLLLERTP